MLLFHKISLFFIEGRSHPHTDGESPHLSDGLALTEADVSLEKVIYELCRRTDEERGLRAAPSVVYSLYNNHVRHENWTLWL